MMGQRADYDPPGYEPRRRLPGEVEILRTEFSEHFVDLMRNRMIVSYYKYGAVAEGFPERLDAVRSLKQRLDKYAATGNAEWLVDAANYAMIEFMHPGGPRPHFEATSADQSPGRTRATGHVDDKENRVDSAAARMMMKLARGGD